MTCSGLANVLSGIALICGPSSGPTFRADHTMIDRLPEVADKDDQASTAMTGILRDASAPPPAERPVRRDPDTLMDRVMVG